MSLDHIGKLPEVDQWESTTFAWETQDEDNIPGHQDLIDDGNAALTAADRHVAALEAAMTAKATPGVEDDVLADWEDFWREIVCPNGPLDLAQVARELFDYHVAMKQVAIVYCDITGNRFSKPNTSASHVIDAAYEYIEKPLLARIAELEELSKTSICIFCGTTMDKDLTVMLEHAKGCEKRPENRLTVRIAELETENREQQRILDMVAHPGSAEYATMQAKAALAEKDLSYREAATRAVDAEAALAERDRTSLDWATIEWLDRWIDEGAPEHLSTALLDAMRCAKCAEEAGEVIAAYIGLTGQNPRKGRTHDLDDVLSELADVCITALCAIQHFTHNTRETQAVVDSRLRRCRARAEDGRG